MAAPKKSDRFINLGKDQKWDELKNIFNSGEIFELSPALKYVFIEVLVEGSQLDFIDEMYTKLGKIKKRTSKEHDFFHQLYGMRVGSLIQKYLENNSDLFIKILNKGASDFILSNATGLMMHKMRNQDFSFWNDCKNSKQIKDSFGIDPEHPYQAAAVLKNILIAKSKNQDCPKDLYDLILPIALKDPRFDLTQPSYEPNRQVTQEGYISKYLYASMNILDQCCRDDDSGLFKESVELLKPLFPSLEYQYFSLTVTDSLIQHNAFKCIDYWIKENPETIVSKNRSFMERPYFDKPVEIINTPIQYWLEKYGNSQPYEDIKMLEIISECLKNMKAPSFIQTKWSEVATNWVLDIEKRKPFQDIWVAMRELTKERKEMVIELTESFPVIQCESVNKLICAASPTIRM